MSLTMPLHLDATQARPIASWMFLAWLSLLTLGVCMVASASVEMAPGLLSRHLLFLFLALLAMIAALALPLDVLRQVHRVAIWVALMVCVVVLVPGIGSEAKGARRWIRISSFSIQASELAKPVVLVGIVGALLVLEPDFGGAVVVASTVGGMLFVGGARLRHFLLLVSAFGALGTLLVLTEAERMRRVTTFLDPWQSANGDGYQLVQSLIAFGRGEVTGVGFGESVQKLHYLPEAHNDFIIAIVAEELGVLGVLALMVLFVVMVCGIWARARTHLREERRFIGYLCYGIGLLFSLQFLVNVGVCTGALPTKGLTLPFISSGGNSLIVSCVLFALVLRGDIEAAEAAATRQPRKRRPRRE